MAKTGRPKTTDPKKIITVRLRLSLIRRLKKKAKKEKRSFSSLIEIGAEAVCPIEQ